MFEKISEYGHEQVLYCSNEKLGLKAIIAVHSTVLGPSLGGVRMWDYKSDEDALYDVLRLSRGMSLKNAVVGLGLGGGKAVIIGDSARVKNARMLQAFGEHIERLHGTYITAEDVNMTTMDMAHISLGTNHVVGLEGKSGNPSPFTARGVYQGIKAASLEKFGTTDLKGVRIAVSGVGSVGYELCHLLHKDGAKLIVSDIRQLLAARAAVDFNADVVNPHEILKCEAEIFAPCALGAVINENNAQQIKFKMVAGAANNVLVDNRAGDIMHEREILYVPDYIINAGGVINVSFEALDIYDKTKVLEKVDGIYDTVENLLKFAKAENLPTHLAADIFAQSIIDDAQKAKNRKRRTR